ncbi:MAG: hypothetical protein GX879_08705 [Bacteroidales bacterium]|nr:hypothetical protein [Bacteroidales bacterium]
MQNESLNIIFYHGEFDSLKLNSLELSLLDYLDANDFPKNIKSRLKWVFLEMISNIQNHAEKKADCYSSIEFKFNKKNEEFIIISENCLKTLQAKYLQANISRLNNMSSDDLQNKYLKVMENADEKTAHAGLGLIGIARKSDNIVSEIKSVNDNISKIKIQVSINL